MIKLSAIQKAKERLHGVVNKTPFAYAPILSQSSGFEVYLKKENLQLTGSFKIRGAFNKIASLHAQNPNIEVVTASAGNHAQGVAFSSKHFGINATIVMPESTPLTKVNGVRSYGATVVLHGANYDEAYQHALSLSERENVAFVHPFADSEVMAGQGTIALEILDEIKHLDAIVVPMGGGGLISGIASALKALNPAIKVIGVNSKGAPALNLSYKAHRPIDSLSVKTIADGIAVRDTSPVTLKEILESVDEVVEVDDDEIADAILFLLERQKLLVEGAGAVGIASIMHNKIDMPKGAKIATILSGGNIDVTMLSVIIEKGLVKSYRKLKLIVTLVDKAGSLMGLTNILQQTNANIVQIGYDRTSTSLDFGDANVSISVETKGLEHQKLIKEALTSGGYKFVEQI